MDTINSLVGTNLAFETQDLFVETSATPLWKHEKQELAFVTHPLILCALWALKAIAIRHPVSFSVAFMIHEPKKCLCFRESNCFVWVWIKSGVGHGLPYGPSYPI